MPCEGKLRSLECLKGSQVPFLPFCPTCNPPPPNRSRRWSCRRATLVSTWPPARLMWLSSLRALWCRPQALNVVGCTFLGSFWVPFFPLQIFAEVRQNQHCIISFFFQKEGLEVVCDDLWIPQGCFFCRSFQRFTLEESGLNRKVLIFGGFCCSKS